MSKDNKSKQTLMAYYQYIPEIVRYRLIVTLSMIFGYKIIKSVSIYLFHTLNKVAFTSADFMFVFKSWQGYVILILLFIIGSISLALDVIGTLLLAKKVVKKEKISIIKIIIESFKDLKLFLNVDGFFFELFCILGTPIAGFGLMSSLSKDLYVPTFITDVVFSNVFYSFLYLCLEVLITWFGIKNIFVLPYMILEEKKPRDILKDAHKMLKDNFKSFAYDVFMIFIKLSILNYLI